MDSICPDGSPAFIGSHNQPGDEPLEGDAKLSQSALLTAPSSFATKIDVAESVKRERGCRPILLIVHLLEEAARRDDAVQRGATRDHFSGVGFPSLALLALADVVDRATRQHAYDACHALRRREQIGIVFKVEAPFLIFRRVRLLDRAAEVERPAHTCRPSPMRGEWVSDEVHERELEEFDPVRREAVR